MYWILIILFLVGFFAGLFFRWQKDKKKSIIFSGSGTLETKPETSPPKSHQSVVLPPPDEEAQAFEEIVERNRQEGRDTPLDEIGK